MVENLETAVLLFDSDLSLLAINSAGENLLHNSERQLLGKSAKQVFTYCPECVATLSDVLENQRSVTRRELVMMVLPGKEITVDCAVTPVSKGLLMELTRIDRLVRLAREEMLLGQYEATRDVLRGIAHEVKNPLGGLRGAAQLLDMEISDPALKEYTGVIIREADRLGAMVDKMVGPNRPLQMEPLNIHRVLEHVRTVITAEYPDLVRIETSYDPSLPELEGNMDALIQAVLNLARNAVQAMLDQPAGKSGVPNVLILRTRAEPRFTIGNTLHRLVLRVDIEDNGPGIPAELRDTVFFPLITSKPEGTGLGLPFVQTIVSQHAGLVEYTSRPGKTVFSIYLPLENHS